MTEQKRYLEIVPPTTEAILAEHHVIRKRRLFDPIGKP
jgi:hypothetical protein